MWEVSIAKKTLRKWAGREMLSGVHVAKWAIGKSREPAGEGAVQSGGGRQILGSDAKPGTYDSVVVDTLCEKQFVLSLFFFLDKW